MTFNEGHTVGHLIPQADWSRSDRTKYKRSAQSGAFRNNDVQSLFARVKRVLFGYMVWTNYESRLGEPFTQNVYNTVHLNRLQQDVKKTPGIYGYISRTKPQCQETALNW
jgi:hypothetical protein